MHVCICNINNKRWRIPQIEHDSSEYMDIAMKLSWPTFRSDLWLTSSRMLFRLFSVLPTAPKYPDGPPSKSDCLAFLRLTKTAYMLSLRMWLLGRRMPSVQCEMLRQAGMQLLARNEWVLRLINMFPGSLPMMYKLILHLVLAYKANICFQWWVIYMQKNCRHQAVYFILRVICLTYSRFYLSSLPIFHFKPCFHFPFRFQMSLPISTWIIISANVFLQNWVKSHKARGHIHDLKS